MDMSIALPAGLTLLIFIMTYVSGAKSKARDNREKKEEAERSRLAAEKEKENEKNRQNDLALFRANEERRVENAILDERSKHAIYRGD